MKNVVNALKNKTVIAIDPATHSLAFAALNNSNGDINLKGYGKIDLKGLSVKEKFDRINASVPLLVETYSPNLIAIEQPIYIQNFQTSRGISYVVGYTWGRFNQEKLPVVDVGPMQWKAGIGYKKVSAKEKSEWSTIMTPVEVKKKAEFERKNRVKFILDNIFDIKNIDDNDIIDAIGIGYWSIKNL